MNACAAVLVLCLSGRAGQDTKTTALELLDSVSSKAWAKPDPRPLVGELLRTTLPIDPKRASEKVRTASERLVKMRLPSQRRSWHADLAGLVAPHDGDSRDLLLRRAIDEARMALAATDLWQHDPDEREGIPFGNPQKSLDEEKQLLSFQVQLWERVLEFRKNPASAREAINDLLADARKAGPFGQCVIKAYDEELLQDLSALDPKLLLNPALKHGDGLGQLGLATLCGERAYNRWINRQRDGFTGTLAKHAVENGAVKLNVLKVYKHYDPVRAFAAATAMPITNNPGSDRPQALMDIVGHWAWDDPEAALAAAERETDESLRRTMVVQVLKVWAAKHPEQIEQAIKDYDNAIYRDYARKLAQEELAWRAKGNPPPGTPALAFRRIKPLTAEELKAQGKRRGNPEEHRILENPEDTSWLTGERRQMYLRQAAWLSLFETGKLDGVNRIIQGLRDQAEIDDVLCHVAELAARTGSVDEAITLSKRVTSIYRSVMTTCMIAKTITGDTEGNL